MKPRGAHPHNALTAVKVRNAPPGRHADGNGLYLVVDDSGARRWLLRTTVRGRRADIGLGSAALVPLAEAREKARQMRLIAREGGDPLADRRRQRGVPTFREAAERVCQERSPGWRNTKHQGQWISTLETYAFPVFGDRRVDQVAISDVHSALLPIWHTKAETARRVCQRIGTVLDWAAAHGHVHGENPAKLVRHSLGRQREQSSHHAAMPYCEVPPFVQSLRQLPASEFVRLALEFTILTAARTSEVLKARFDEIKDGVWTIPAGRMKMDREHRVPLSARCQEIVESCRAAHQGEFLFPGRKENAPLSNLAMLMLMRRHAPGYTVHGFRSSFRDWAGEQTSFQHEVCEAALAHVVKNKVEAAYFRSDLFAKRAELMEAWARFVTSGDSCSNVVALRAG